MKTMIVSLAILGAFLMVVAIGLPLLSGDSSRSRLKAVRARREAFRKELQTQQTSRVSLRERMSKRTVARKLTERFRLHRVFNMDTLKARLMAAGWRNTETPSRFLLAHLVLPLVIGGYIAFMCYGGPLSEKVAPAMRPLVLFAGVAVALALPTLLLKNAAQKRAQKLSPKSCAEAPSFRSGRKRAAG